MSASEAPTDVAGSKRGLFARLGGAATGRWRRARSERHGHAGFVISVLMALMTVGIPDSVQHHFHRPRRRRRAVAPVRRRHGVRAATRRGLPHHLAVGSYLYLRSPPAILEESLEALTSDGLALSVQVALRYRAVAGEPRLPARLGGSGLRRQRDRAAGRRGDARTDGAVPDGIDARAAAQPGAARHLRLAHRTARS